MNTKILKLYVKILVAVSYVLAPVVAFAQNDSIRTGLNPLESLFPALPGSIGGSRSLTGPFGLIYNAIFLLLTIAGSAAVLFIIVGGFWYITSAGNEEQAEKGKSTLLNAIIGIVVIVLSYVIINVVSSFVATGY